MYNKKISKFFILMSYCFAVNASQPQDDFQGKVQQINRGFMVGVHFLKQRPETPNWVKENPISSFQGIWDAISEVVVCKMTGKAPTLKYDTSKFNEQSYWDFLFIKRCIARAFDKKQSDDLFESRPFSIYDDVEREMNAECPNNTKEITKAKNTTKGYIDGMKLSSVIAKIKKSLENGDWKMHMPPPPPGMEQHHRQFGEFFGISPFKVFPSLRLRASLPQDIQNWWQPAPPLPPQRDQANGKCSGGKCHGHFGPPPGGPHHGHHGMPGFPPPPGFAHHGDPGFPPPPGGLPPHPGFGHHGPFGGPHHGLEAYWFEAWLPDNIKAECMKPPFHK